MNDLYARSIMIFRRDLRLDDNTALNACVRDSRTIIPIFIIDQRQVGSTNRYKSQHAICFMHESLDDLAQAVRAQGGLLHVLHGAAEKVIREVCIKNDIEAVYFNRDYTPFALKRDRAIEQTCMRHHVACHTFNDLLLTDPDVIKTGQSGIYTQFTAFYKKARTYQVMKPQPFSSPIAWQTTRLKGVVYHNEHVVCPHNQRTVHGGSRQAQKILKQLDQWIDYEHTRNLPALYTTRLSAHNKFGTVSIRRVYYAMKEKLGMHNGLIQELYWRDFFTYLAYHTPRVFKGPFRVVPYRWSTSMRRFERWCTGTTGFPLVDAGMRELNATGFMHNRVRMVVASFLVKDLHINWRWGERYFAQHLVDYDPSVNNGNWQWVSSTGADRQPYFRIFNPWLQQKKFDSDCQYVKQWLPDIATVSVRDIHRWFDARVQKKYQVRYPVPMINHGHERNKTMRMVA